MLQWMGGSRRKVTASRKSTQKRQKQYFEQRKRQQQQPETVDNLVACDHPKRNRSLDILSLLNVSKFAKEIKPLSGIENASNLTNKVNGASCVDDVGSGLMKNDKGHAYAASYNTSTTTPIKSTNEFAASEFTVPIETGDSSLHQMGTVSSKSCRGNSLNGKSTESEFLKNAASTQSSIFDIIGDDEPIRVSKEPSKEAHVAFSIEGLGTVRSETPMQSPQHLGSKLNGEQSSFTKTDKNLNSFNNFYALPDDLSMEVESLIHNVEKPSRRHDLTRYEIHPFTNFDHELSTFNDDMKLDGKQCKMKSLFYEDRHDNFFDASSLGFDDYEVDEKFGVNLRKYDGTNSTSYFGKKDSSYKKFGVNLENHDGFSNSYIGRNDSPNFKFERFNSPVRQQEKIPDEYDDLDGECQLTTFDEPKYTPFMSNNRTQDYSPFVRLEDMQDNLTSFSRKSCSSTAAGGMRTANVPYARVKKTYGENLDVPLELNPKDDNDFGMWNQMSNKPKQGDKYCFSQKNIRHNSSRSRSSFFSGPTENEKEDCYHFEEEFPRHKIKSRPGSSFFTPFKKTPHKREDSFILERETDSRKSKYFFNGPQKDVSNEFSSENFGSFVSSKPCDSSFVSNFDEVSREHESNFLDAELSAQGSVTEEVGDKSKTRSSHPEKCIQSSMQRKEVIQEKYSTPESDLLTRKTTTLKEYDGSRNDTKNGGSQEVNENGLKEDEEETSLFNNFTCGPDNELNTPSEELQGIIPALVQQEVKVPVDDYNSLGGKDKVAHNLTGPQPKTAKIDPCYQLMTVERYVLKHFSVPKEKRLSRMP